MFSHPRVKLPNLSYILLLDGVLIVIVDFVSRFCLVGQNKLFFSRIFIAKRRKGKILFWTENCESLVICISFELPEGGNLNGLFATRNKTINRLHLDINLNV